MPQKVLRHLLIGGGEYKNIVKFFRVKFPSFSIYGMKSTILQFCSNSNLFIYDMNRLNKILGWLQKHETEIEHLIHIIHWFIEHYPY